MACFPRVEVRVSHSGSGYGVFAAQLIGRGKRILRFGGAVLNTLTFAAAAGADAHDGYLQIGEGRYLGPSGTADDFINHCYCPNTYVAVARRATHLVALRDIEAGEELSFDYGLTQIAFPLRFRCRCGVIECRSEIGNYDEVPLAVMSRYRAQGVLPGYILARLDRELEQLTG